MEIIIDDNIPYAMELFSTLGKVKIIPSWKISTDKLNLADALIVRSTTNVNESLLSKKPVRFVGTVTSGTDHIDISWIKKSGIFFSAAYGCNAIAVVEYVFSVLLIIAEKYNFSLQDRIIGIIGVGNIGGYLNQCLKTLGLQTILCDPPRADRGDNENFVSINELIEKADILTFHTPFLKEGPYKTLHLIDKELIVKMKPGTVLINTCRGPIIDNSALLSCLKSGQFLIVILDVWESEPNLDVSLLNLIDIGTAHIAGYSIEGKIRGTIKIFEEYSAFLGNPQKVKINTLLPPPEFSDISLHGKLNQSKLKRLVHFMYDVRYDDAKLRKSVHIPDAFYKLRKHCFMRREWSSLNVKCDNVKSAILLNKLGFNATYCLTD